MNESDSEHNIKVEDCFCPFEYNWGLTVLNHVMHLILLKEHPPTHEEKVGLLFPIYVESKNNDLSIGFK